MTLNSLACFSPSLRPIRFKEGKYRPHTLGIAKWSSKAKNKAFFRTSVFKKAKYLRDRALDRLDVFHAKVMIR